MAFKKSALDLTLASLSSRGSIASLALLCGCGRVLANIHQYPGTRGFFCGLQELRADRLFKISFAAVGTDSCGDLLENHSGPLPLQGDRCFAWTHVPLFTDDTLHQLLL